MAGEILDFVFLLASDAVAVSGAGFRLVVCHCDAPFDTNPDAWLVVPRLHLTTRTRNISLLCGDPLRNEVAMGGRHKKRTKLSKPEITRFVSARTASNVLRAADRAVERAFPGAG